MSTVHFRRRHAGSHQRERAAKSGCKCTVSVEAISDDEHPVRCHPVEQMDHGRGHRLVWFAGHDRGAATCRRDRGDDRTGAGNQPFRRREGDIAVGGDESGPPANGVGRDAQALVVELPVQADHHGVDRLAGRVVTRHGDGTPGTERFGDPRSAAHEYPLAGLDQGRPGHGRGQHVTGRWDADGGESGLLFGDAGGGVVGDEHDAPAGLAETGDRLDRAGDRLVGEPDDSVEIAEHGGRVQAHAGE